MPLSEHEQRQLEAIERALYADDPKFAHAVRFTNPKSRGRRRLIGGVTLVVLGLAVVLSGVIASLWFVGLIGFLVMLLGATRGYSGVRQLTGQTPTEPRSGGTKRGPGLRHRGPHPPSSGGWRERFEERWNHRFDEGR